jgi:acetylornithine/N-succinyldiaminopimelate aminotransferase
VPDRAARTGEQLTKALLTLPAVTTVRGAGLLLAAELAPGLEAAAVVQACLTRSLLVNAVTPTAVRLAPSLLVGDDDIGDAVTILDVVLRELQETSEVEATGSSA